MALIDDMKAAAQKAGEFMKNSTEYHNTEKSNSKDFVTVSDIKAQDILRAELRSSHPGVTILSEEDSEQERKPMYDSDFTGFVLDPIDGTYNFKRDMRESAVSVGYIKDGKSVAGVIYDPYKDELYVAEVEKGAYRNGERIHVSDQTELRGASVATGNSYDDEAMARNLRRHVAIYDTAAVMPWTSCPGSGVLTMAWVACGRIDAYHHNGLKPWDNAAAFLLVREAGGVVETLNGQYAPFTSATTVMGTASIVTQLKEIFAKNPELNK